MSLSIHNLYVQSTYFLHVMAVYRVNNLESVGLKPNIHSVHECADGKQNKHGYDETPVET